MNSNLTTYSKSIWKRLSESPFVLIVLMLLMVDLVTTGLIPAVNPEWYIAQFPNPDRHCAKVLHYLNNSANPQIIILGSSLMRTAAENSDLSIAKGCTEERFANDYSKATFLEQQLHKQLGVDLSVLNLAMRGCMASDYDLIFKKALAVGKQPKFVLCATAPAEFMSNDQPVVDKTYVHLSLLNYAFPQGKPFFVVAGNDLQRAIAPHNLDAVEQVLGYARRNIAQYLSDATGHPTDLYQLTHKVAQAKKPAANEIAQCDDSATAGNRLRDLAHFKMRYNPPNTKLFAQHAHNFAELARLSHESGIPLVVINMPITEPNKKLIDPTLLRRYYEFMESTTKKYNIAYLNMDNADMYAISDFMDSSHLNAAGSKKFFTALAQDLVKETNLSSVASRKADGQLRAGAQTSALIHSETVTIGPFQTPTEYTELLLSSLRTALIMMITTLE